MRRALCLTERLDPPHRLTAVSAPAAVEMTLAVWGPERAVNPVRPSPCPRVSSLLLQDELDAIVLGAAFF